MDIAKFLEVHYGFDEVGLQYLEGFENKTYRIDFQGKSFVLKQYTYSAEAEQIIKAEDRILNRLNELDYFSFPKTILSLEEKPFIVLDGKLIRLLTFVSGNLLGNVDKKAGHLRSLGVLLGIMDRQLIDLYEPALKGREDEWDLRHFQKNLKYLPYIENATDRSLVRYFYHQYNEHVLPKADEMRMGLIHNDANDWNIVVDSNQVTGIFDFGDLAYSWLINELAIGITYIMMETDNPLDSAVEVLRGYHKEYPLKAEELDLLYYLVAARLCVSVIQSAYGKTIKPDSEYVTISEKQAWALLHKWISINPLQAQKTFRESLNFKWNPISTRSELMEKRSSYLSKSLSLSYQTAIPMAGAAFQYMYDMEGNTFLDAYNNIMLAGHCHPHVVHAGQRMMAQLNTNTRYLYQTLNDYCENLLSRFPNSLNKVFLVNSGSEASDLAIRMARVHTRRQKVLVLENGYHGSTSTGIEISHYKYGSEKGIGKPDSVVQTPMPKAFGSDHIDDGSCGKHFATILAENMKAHHGEIAAFIAEPVMGCGGQVPLAKSFLKEVYPLVREQGGLCISDEVQVGFGRLGSWFWGFEMHGIVPDLVVLGKPMGNGHPIGAVITTEAIAASFEEGPEFFSSFGGNPVSCAIGHAVLDVIDEEGLQASALETGSYLKSLLNALQLKFPVMGDVRGHGLFLGVELINPMNKEPETELSQRIKNKLKEGFVLIGTDGPYQNVLKIKPPLSFNKKNAKALADKLEAILDSEL